MYFSIAIGAALVSLHAFVSANGKFGFALGTKNPDGSCKYTADYEKDFDAIFKASSSRIVRGYSASDCNCAQQILPAAKNKNFLVVLGVWPDVDTSFNADTAALQQYVPQYTSQVYAITVGSETLYRGTFTGAQLLSKINAVKAMFPKMLVGTADSWNKYADGTADPVIQGGVELLLVNAFGYWQGQPISNASATYFDDIHQAFGHIQQLAGPGNAIELWNGETGWPTRGGTNYGAAVANTVNAIHYYHQGVCAMRASGVNVFYFEAFDEPWKPASVGDNGQSSVETVWGAMYANRSLKATKWNRDFTLMC